MNIKTLMATTIATVVLVVLASAAVVPVISEAQKVSGKEVVYENGNLYGYHLGDSTESATMTFNYEDGWKYNGETPEGGFFIVSETFTIQAYGDEGERAIITRPTGSIDIRTAWHSNPVSINIGDGLITMDLSDSHESYSYDWILMPKENGEWQTKSGLYTVYANSISDVIVAGYYSTGENDTEYCLKGGVLSITEDYDSSYTYDKTLVEGTTDVYQIENISVNVGGETFSPWFCLVKSEIIGHEDHGANYSLIGIIPLLIFTGLVIGVVGSFIRNRD